MLGTDRIADVCWQWRACRGLRANVKNDGWDGVERRGHAISRTIDDRSSSSVEHGKNGNATKPNDRWGGVGDESDVYVGCRAMALLAVQCNAGRTVGTTFGQASASCGSIGVDGVWVCESSVQLRPRPLWRGVPTWRKRCTTPSLRTERRRRRSCVREIYLQRNTANRRPVFVFSVASSASSSSLPHYLLGPRTAHINIIIYKHTVVVIIVERLFII